MDERGTAGTGAVPGLLATVSAVCANGRRGSGTDGASVSLAADGHGLSPVWASDLTAEVLEERQITVGEGPCLEAISTGLPVLVEDLERPGDGLGWPAFLREVTGLGARSLFAFPLQIGAISLGTLELYRREPGSLSASQLGAALNTADVLGGVLLGLGADSQVDEVVPHYRLAVHQAAGMITVQLGVPIEEAMVRLRGRAYLEGTPINELAADVVAGRLRFTEEDS